jgi:hypothetical protein
MEVIMIVLRTVMSTELQPVTKGLYIKASNESNIPVSSKVMFLTLAGTLFIKLRSFPKQQVYPVLLEEMKTIEGKWMVSNCASQMQMVCEDL